MRGYYSVIRHELDELAAAILSVSRGRESLRPRAGWARVSEARVSAAGIADLLAG